MIHIHPSFLFYSLFSSIVIKYRKRSPDEKECIAMNTTLQEEGRRRGLNLGLEFDLKKRENFIFEGIQSRWNDKENPLISKNLTIIICLFKQSLFIPVTVL
jgi:hypothetical protein